jgi:hypothetical protein
MKMKEIYIIVIVILLLASIPVAMSVGKYQVCKIYFPEINRYACLFTNLPPVIRK